MAEQRRRRRRSSNDDEPVARNRSSRSGGQSAKLDMRGVEKGRRTQRYPEGDYKVKIAKAERATNENSGNSQIILTMEIVEPEKFEGKPVKDYLSLTKKAMYRVGWVLDAVGINWSQKVLTLPLGKLEGKTIGISLVDDEYNNKTRSKVSEYFSKEEIDALLAGETADLEDEEDEDYEEFDEDEDEDEDEEDLEELDDDDL